MREGEDSQSIDESAAGNRLVKRNFDQERLEKKIIDDALEEQKQRAQQLVIEKRMQCE